MSRILKFRAWDKTNKEMLPVPSLHFGDDGSGLTTTLWTKKPDGYVRFFVNGENAELMQYTGLKDKNGKEVYEGDILRGDRGDTCVVTWEDEIDRDRYWATAYGFSIYFGDSHATGEIEIIGNIYEHPDLMKGNV